MFCVTKRQVIPTSWFVASCGQQVQIQVTGLEIWRQMAVTYAGSAQTRVVTLLKQIMTPSEWNPEKSSNVLQMHHHWLELISKYESLSSEKIASSIKITLALQNMRGPLAKCSITQHQ